MNDTNVKTGTTVNKTLLGWATVDAYSGEVTGTYYTRKEARNNANFLGFGDRIAKLNKIVATVTK
jgi:hypothetical protein